MVTLLGARAHFMINWLIWLELEAEHRCELCTNIAPVRSYTPKYQVMRVGKNAWAQVWIVYNHCACTCVRSRAHHSTRHQIRGGGNTHPPPLWPGPGSHRHPWPGSDLWRPGVTDTGHSPSSPATLPYSVSSLAPQQSSKYCKIWGDKDKTTGSFTINILKILAYCCTI